MAENTVASELAVIAELGDRSSELQQQIDGLPIEDALTLAYFLIQGGDARLAAPFENLPAEIARHRSQREDMGVTDDNWEKIATRPANQDDIFNSVSSHTGILDKIQKLEPADREEWLRAYLKAQATGLNTGRKKPGSERPFSFIDLHSGFPQAFARAELNRRHPQSEMRPVQAATTAQAQVQSEAQEATPQVSESELQAAQARYDEMIQAFSSVFEEHTPELSAIPGSMPEFAAFVTQNIIQAKLMLLGEQPKIPIDQSKNPAHWLEEHSSEINGGGEVLSQAEILELQKNGFMESKKLWELFVQKRFLTQ